MPEFSQYQLRKWSARVRWAARKCEICHSREKLESHHLNSKAHFPDQAYDLDNGVCLCGDNKKTGNACHRTFHNVFKGGTRRKCTRADFYRFVDMIRYSQGIRTKQ